MRSPKSWRKKVLNLDGSQAAELFIRVQRVKLLIESYSKQMAQCLIWLLSIRYVRCFRNACRSCILFECTNYWYYRALLGDDLYLWRAANRKSQCSDHILSQCTFIPFRVLSSRFFFRSRIQFESCKIQLAGVLSDVSTCFLLNLNQLHAIVYQ